MLSDRRRRAAAAALLLAAFVVLYLLSNRTALGQSLENSWARQFDAVTPGLWLDDTRWFPPFHLAEATVVGGTALAALIAGLRRAWRSLAVIVTAVPVALVAGDLFKAVTGRPHLVASLDTDPSFPSGHAGVALAVTAALLVAVPPRSLRVVLPVLAGWCVLVAGGLQAEGQHRASEVIGSGLLVAAVFTLASALIGRPSPRVVPPMRRSWTVGALVAVAALAVLGSWDPVWWQVVVYAAAAVAATFLVAGSALAARAAVDPGRSEASPRSGGTRTPRRNDRRARAVTAPSPSVRV